MSKEDPDAESQELSQLRNEVKLTSSKLLDLTYHEAQYLDTLEQYNSKAKDLILSDMLEEALVYLSESQKLLEYGASCGKNIDRKLIMCILHNEACCYYKASDLVTSSRYIEGVIYNLNAYVESADNSLASSGHSEKSKKSDDLVVATVEKKAELVHYYLKYCTINSQAKNRIIALDAGKRTIQVLRSVLTDAKEHPVLCNHGTQDSQGLASLLARVRFFREDIKGTEVGDLLTLTRHFLRKWNEQKLVKKISYALEKHVSNYSISEVIQMTPLDYQAESPHSIGNKSLIRQMLHFAMGYFTISTEYRLIAEQLYRKSEERQACEEYRKANIYHLLSVAFLALYVHCDLLFMKQIVSSYQHHFKRNLLQEDAGGFSLELAERVLFQPAQRKKSINASLSAKLQKLRSKSKERSKVHTQYEDTDVYESKACYKLNQTKTKGKRSTSKQRLLKGEKPKKCGKILNDSLFEQTKNLNVSKENKPRSISNANNIKKRSVSQTNKVQTSKKQAEKRQRSKSKGQQLIKHVKSPIKMAEKAMVARDKKGNSKRYNDQYQLGKSKCPGAKKRSHSISSADLSCSIRDTNRTKESGEKSRPKKVTKKVEGKSSRGKERVSKGKGVYSKHYYV